MAFVEVVAILLGGHRGRRFGVGEDARQRPGVDLAVRGGRARK